MSQRLSVFMSLLYASKLQLSIRSRVFRVASTAQAAGAQRSSDQAGIFVFHIVLRVPVSRPSRVFFDSIVLRFLCSCASGEHCSSFFELSSYSSTINQHWTSIELNLLSLYSLSKLTNEEQLFSSRHVGFR